MRRIPGTCTLWIVLLIMGSSWTSSPTASADDAVDCKFETASVAHHEQSWQLWGIGLASLLVVGAVKEVTSDSSVDARLDGFPACLESLKTPAAVTRPSGRILLSNGHLLQLFPRLGDETGRPSTVIEMIVEKCSDETRQEAQSRLDGLVAELATSPEAREISVVCSKRFSLRISVSPQVREEGRVFLLWVIRNQGAEHLLEERDEHSRKMRTITRFAGGMAHDSTIF